MYSLYQPDLRPLVTAGKCISLTALRCQRISHGPLSEVMKSSHRRHVRARETRSRAATVGRSESVRRSTGRLERASEVAARDIVESK